MLISSNLIIAGCTQKQRGLELLGARIMGEPASLISAPKFYKNVDPNTNQQTQHNKVNINTPSSRTTTGTCKFKLLQADVIPSATIEQSTIPPKMFTNIDFTYDANTP